MIPADKLQRYWEAPSQTEMSKIKWTKDQIEAFLRRHLKIDEIKKNHWLSSFDYDVYLQGSYANSTNVSFSSDVDIVIEFTSAYYYNSDLLNPVEKDIFNKSLTSGSDYDMVKFKNDIYNLFNNSRWGPEYKAKCIMIPWNSNRCDADIVPSFRFKKLVSPTSSIDGIKFKNTSTGETIINYPKNHKLFMTEKNKNTGQKFKKIIRTFKNIRNDMVNEGLLSSNMWCGYFIENMIYNVPNSVFEKYASYQYIFEEVLDYCQDIDNFKSKKCANKMNNLFWGNMWEESEMQFFVNRFHRYYLDN